VRARLKGLPRSCPIGFVRINLLEAGRAVS
jgi:putative transposase